MKAPGSSIKKTYLYWTATVILAIIYFITGVGNLIPFEHIASDVSRLGYPPYFMKILGVWKIIGALAILLPVSRTFKTAAYAGMIIDLTAAIYSRAVINDSPVTMLIPLFIVGIVILSWVAMPRKQAASFS